MFTKSPYQIMRTFNKVLLADCIYENASQSTIKKWLKRFYKEHNKAKRKYLDWDNDYINVENVIDFDFCEMFTTRYFSYNEHLRFNNKLHDVRYRLGRYNQIIDNRQLKIFIRFLDCYTDWVNDVEQELFDLNWCEDCELYMPSEDSVTVYSGDRTVCVNCRDEDYYYHDGSDQYVRNDDDEYDYEDHEEDHDSNFEGVYRYDYDVMDRLSKMKLSNEPDINRKTLLAGLECEWEARNDCPSDFPEQIDSLFDGQYCMFKGDGSLRNGFEMVTAPCTLAYHKNKLDKLFSWHNWTDSDSNTRVKAWNTDTCGIHVHLNRASFTASQIGKLQVIINEPVNRNFIEAVAGRKANEYAKFKQKRIAEGGQRDYNKYEAVNTAHAQSIELRIFRGNATKNGILRVLEFSFALGEYVQQCSFNELHYRDFLKWFKLPRNRADFPYINEWFVRKGYLKDSRPNRLVTNEINEAIDNVVNG
jgi:hypothetical protein|tara:strand:+ start:553 stop:1974 length:1422 start_codon:yes stop_codon:yes gene_type:complete